MRFGGTVLSRGITVFMLVSILGLGGCIADLFSNNSAPVPTRSIPLIRIQYGTTDSLSLSPFFRDPDGDPLTFTAWATPRSPFFVSVSESTLIFRPSGGGDGVAVVRARDPGGKTARQVVSVEVGHYIIYSPPPPPPAPDRDAP